MRHYIGLSTTELFDVLVKPIIPLFERPVPKGELICISDRVVPADRRNDPSVEVIADEQAEHYAATIKAHVDAIKRQLKTPGFRDWTDGRTFERCRSSNLRPSREILDLSFDRELDMIVGEPVNCSLPPLYAKNILEREGWPKQFDFRTARSVIDTGLPWDQMMTLLVYDVLVEREEKASLVLNSTTELGIERARRILSALEKKMLIPYLATE